MVQAMSDDLIVALNDPSTLTWSFELELYAPALRPVTYKLSSHCRFHVRHQNFRRSKDGHPDGVQALAEWTLLLGVAVTACISAYSGINEVGNCLLALGRLKRGGVEEKIKLHLFVEFHHNAYTLSWPDVWLSPVSADLA